MPTFHLTAAEIAAMESRDGVVVGPKVRLPALPVEPVDEKEFSRQFRELFESLGWEGYHTYDSRRSKAGFSDWVLWRERILFVELKTETGRLTAAQECFRDQIKEAGGEYYCFRPGDYAEMVRALRRLP